MTFWSAREWSTAGNERDDDVCGMSVEVLTSSVIDRRRPRIGMSGGDLDIAQRNTGVERGHDEPGPQHVGVDGPKTSPLADRAHPTVGGSAVEALAVSSAKDRALRSLTDGEVNRSCRARHERDDGGFVALPDDAKGSVSAIEAEIFDVRPARLAHPKPFSPRSTARAA